MFRRLSNTIGAADDYDFYSADEYVSTDPAQPTIFRTCTRRGPSPAVSLGWPAFGLLEQACLLSEPGATIDITGGELTLHKEALLRTSTYRAQFDALEKGTGEGGLRAFPE